jgi:hypothetical protein
MMQKISKYLIVFILLVCAMPVKTTAQEMIIDNEFGIEPGTITRDNNGNVLIGASVNDTTPFWQTMIIKVTPEMDTTCLMIDDTLNELFAPRILVTRNNHYIVHANEGLVGNSNLYLEWLAIFTFNENLEMLNFNRYHMELGIWIDNEIKFHLIQNDDGRIFGFGSRGDNFDYVVLEITESGDTLRTQRIPSGLGNPTQYSDVFEANHDSIACMGFVNGFDQQGSWKTITLDTAFNYSYSTIVLPQGFNGIQFVKANWLNDSVYLAVGHIGFAEDKFFYEDLVLYKANANNNHEVIAGPLHIVRPDTTDFTATNIPTFVDPGHIYVGSYRGSYPGSSYNGRYLVALVDQNLNLLGMKSLGKDGYQYDMKGMQATDDLGCVVTGTVHDNANSPSYDWDTFIRKIMPDQIVGVAEETEDPDDSDYFIYPNPGNNVIRIATARRGVEVCFVDLQGKAVLKEKIDQGLDHSMDVSKLPTGTYIIVFTDDQGFTEKIKWIKN